MVSIKSFLESPVKARQWKHCLKEQKQALRNFEFCRFLLGQLFSNVVMVFHSRIFKIIYKTIILALFHVRVFIYLFAKLFEVCLILACKISQSFPTCFLFPFKI